MLVIEHKTVAPHERRDNRRRTQAGQPVSPSGPGWLNEIKHDGFRILARRDGSGVAADNRFSLARVARQASPSGTADIRHRLTQIKADSFPE